MQVGSEAMAKALTILRRLMAVNYPVEPESAPCAPWSAKWFEWGQCLMTIRWSDVIKVCVLGRGGGGKVS